MADQRDMQKGLPCLNKEGGGRALLNFSDLPAVWRGSVFRRAWVMTAVRRP